MTGLITKQKMYIYIYIDFYLYIIILSNISFLSPCVKQFVVLTAFKSLLILDHILGPRNDIFFCPKAVFRKGISNTICDLVLYLFKEGVNISLK